MKAPEKAKELIESYKNHAYTNVFSFRLESNFSNAKKCALIAVTEIIKALETTTGHCNLRKLDQQEVDSDFNYWANVKTNIEKSKYEPTI